MKNVCLGLALIGLFVASLVGCGSPASGHAATTSTPKSDAVVTSPDKASAPLATIVRPAYETDPDARDSEYRERSVLKKQFFDAARELVEKANSQQHTDVYNFIVKNGRMVLPLLNQYVLVEPKPKDESRMFTYLLLQPKDAQLGEPWSGLLERLSACASYSSDNRMIILDPSQTSSRELMGLSLLHEGHHAWGHLEKQESQPKFGDAVAFCAGEIETHQFIGELMIKVHPKYQNLINDIAKQIERVEEKGVITVRSDQVLRAEIDQRLPEVLGWKSGTEKERRILNVDVWYLANFRSIEKKFPKHRWRDEKIAFLKNYLEAKGTPQWIAR